VESFFGPRLSSASPGDGTTSSPYLATAIDPATGTQFYRFPAEAGRPTTIDPPGSKSYAYLVLSGPAFASTLVPPGQGDDAFTLLYGEAVAGLLSGVSFTFPDPTNRFAISGIEGIEGAFLTSFTFATSGEVLMAQVPFGSLVAVPEPSTLALVAVGVLGLLVTHRPWKAAG
jgi:hypothetical protein